MFKGPLSQSKRKSSTSRAGSIALFGALALHSVQLAADDSREKSIDLNGLSVHSEDRYVEDGVSREYNETNPGLGVSIEWTEWNDFAREHDWAGWIDRAGIDADLKVGFFENSYHKTSLYAGTFLHKDLAPGDWKFAPGLGVLLVSGYDDTPEDAPKVFPLPVLGLEVGHKALKLNIGYVPWGRVDFATVQLQFVSSHW